MVVSLDLGCGKQTPVVTPTAQTRQSVPLRILLVGEPGDHDAVSRGWQAVSEQMEATVFRKNATMLLGHMGSRWWGCV